MAEDLPSPSALALREIEAEGTLPEREREREKELGGKECGLSHIVQTGISTQHTMYIDTPYCFH